MKARITQMLQHINVHSRVTLSDVHMRGTQTAKAEQLERLLREKEREIDRLRHALANTEARLQELIGTDVLTNLPNRHVFKEHFTHSLKRALRLGYCLSLLLIDIDRLRDINLRHGHEVGDSVLIEVAKILKSSVREIDVPARWGGEELVAVLHETDTDGAAAVAERIRRRVTTMDIRDPKTGRQINLSASLAVASYPKHSSDPQSLLEAACEALIQAKEAGGNIVVIADNH